MGTVLRQLLHRRRYADSMRIHEIHRAWPGIVGPLLAARSAPLVLRDRRLTVGVSDSVWLQELSFLRAEILDHVRVCLAALGGDDGAADFALVQEVRFRLVPGASALPPSGSAGAPRAVAWPGDGGASPEGSSGIAPRAAGADGGGAAPAPAPEAIAVALAEFETRLEQIQDPELRQQIRRAFISAQLRGRGRDPGPG